MAQSLGTYNRKELHFAVSHCVSQKAVYLWIKRTASIELNKCHEKECNHLSAPHTFPWDTTFEYNSALQCYARIFSIFKGHLLYKRCSDRKEEGSHSVRVSVFHKVLSYVNDTENDNCINIWFQHSQPHKQPMPSNSQITKKWKETAEALPTLGNHDWNTLHLSQQWHKMVIVNTQIQKSWETAKLSNKSLQGILK